VKAPSNDGLVLMHQASIAILNLFRKVMASAQEAIAESGPAFAAETAPAEDYAMWVMICAIGRCIEATGGSWTPQLFAAALAHVDQSNPNSTLSRALRARPLPST